MKRLIGGKLVTPRRRGRHGFGSLFSTTPDMKLADRLAREATELARRGDCRQAKEKADRAAALVPAAGGAKGRALLTTIDYAREAAEVCSAGFSGYRRGKKKPPVRQPMRPAGKPVRRQTVTTQSKVVKTTRFGHLFGRR